MRVLVTGARGFVGSHVAAGLARLGHRVLGTMSGVQRSPPLSQQNRVEIELTDMDLLDAAAPARVLADARPDGVVHCAAWPELLRCEQDPAGAEAANVGATAALAAACRRSGARLVLISTDQVFDGERGGYTEADPPTPINVYGRTKASAEHAVIEACRPGRFCSLRLSLVYGWSPSGARSPVEQIIRAVERAERPRLFTDEIRTPVLAEDVGSACGELLSRDEVPPVLHLGGPDRFSRYDLGMLLAQLRGWPEGVLLRGQQREAGNSVRRPRDGSLDSALARSLLTVPPRSVREGLSYMFQPSSARGALMNEPS